MQRDSYCSFSHSHFPSSQFSQKYKVPLPVIVTEESINNIAVTHCPHVKHKIVRYNAVGLSHFNILKLLNDATPMITHSCLYNTISTDTYLQSLHLVNGIHR